MSATDSETGEGDSTQQPDPDPRAELRAITSALRLHTEWLARAGIYAAGGGVSASPSAADDAGDVTPGASATVTSDVTVAATVGTEIEEKRVALAVVREDLGECTRCKLHSTRKKIAFGVGSPGAPLMFVGEAPGEEEDRRGEPFVGAAGQLLDRMIVAMGWTREAVYIANVLKCRPPGNRDPAPDEVAECLPFLHRQIEVLAPRVIVALGRPAAQTLLQTSASISALRGRFHEFRGIPVMPTFHPAFLLRTPDRKRDAWNDLKQVIDELARLGVRSPHPARS